MLTSMNIAMGLEYRYLADLITDELGQHRETLAYSPWTVIATIALTMFCRYMHWYRPSSSMDFSALAAIPLNPQIMHKFTPNHVLALPG